MNKNLNEEKIWLVIIFSHDRHCDDSETMEAFKNRETAQQYYNETKKNIKDCCEEEYGWRYHERNNYFEAEKCEWDYIESVQIKEMVLQ